MLVPESRPTYTNVLINYVPSVLAFDDQPVGDPSYFIEIKTPHSNRPGLYQSLPQKINLPLIEGETLKLKLIPSDFYLPIGRYRVNYYRRGHTDPIHYEEWVVPTYPVVGKRVITIADYNPIPLPYDYFSSASLDWEGEWEVEHNYLVFRSLNPPIGQQLTLTYRAGVTREQIVCYSKTYTPNL